MSESQLIPYDPIIDDLEQPNYRDYLKKLAVSRHLAAAKAYKTGPVWQHYNSLLTNDNNSFNYRRWYNLADDKEKEWGLKKGLGHWTDSSGKTWLHPTFSVESPYSGYKNPYNPYGITGGRWLDTRDPHNERFEFSDDQMFGNHFDINKTLEELKWAREHEGTNPYALYKSGFVLPEITVTPKRKGGKLNYIKLCKFNSNKITLNK